MNKRSMRSAAATSNVAPDPRVRVVEILEATCGGTRRHLVDLLDRLDPDKFRVSLICANTREPNFNMDLQAMQERGITIAIVPMLRAIRPLTEWRAFRSIQTQLRQWRPDIVHTHSAKAGFLGRLAAHTVQVPTLIHTPHHFPFEMDINPLAARFYLQLEKIAARVTHRIICVCPSEQRTALKHRLVDADGCAVIPNGIHPGEMNRSLKLRDGMRRNLGIPDISPVIGVVGRLSKQKGHTYLLEAAALLLPHYPEMRILMVGDGELRPELERQAARLGIAPNCIFAGHREPVHAYYAAMDILAMPSLWEGLPYTMLEGMDAALPVVAFSAGGIADVIVDGKNGRLVEKKDVRSMAGALAELMRSPEQRQQLGREARELVRRSYRIENMVQQTEKLYLTALRKKK